MHIATVESLTHDEKEMVNRLMPEADYGPHSYDHARDHLPGFAYAGGGGGELVPLAWIALSFVGAGGLIMIKKALEAIGTEAGKKVVQYFEKKAASASAPQTSQPANLVVLIYEPTPDAIAAIRIGGVVPSSDTLGAIAAVEEELRQIADRPIVLDVYYYPSGWRAVADRIGAGRPAVWDPKRGVFFIAQ